MLRYCKTSTTSTIEVRAILEPILVTGAGAIGLLTVAVLRAIGARVV
jgi:threonine dehydrogenase-like Zn-dependent dehydrogenase